jgi:hypothetical protein
MSEIRICQFFKLIVSTSDGALANKVHRYQNYFINEQNNLAGEVYDFAPFQAEGALASLNGDNQQLRVLFPNQEIVSSFR